MTTGVPAIPLFIASLALAALLLAAGWRAGRIPGAAEAASGRAALVAALRALLAGVLVGLAVALVAAAGASALPDASAGPGWAWALRPEAVAAVCTLVLLLRVQAGGPPQPWIVPGAAVAAATPWLLSPLALALDARAQLAPLPLGLVAAVLAGLLLSPGRRARLVARAQRLAARAAGDGVLVVDGRGRVLDANAPARQALGLPADPRASAGSAAAPRAVRELLSDSGSRRARLKTTSGRFFEARTTARSARGPLREARAVLLRDITDQYRGERRLVRLAHYDSLTGLANRRLFLDRIRRSLDAARRGGHLAALFYLDLDRFKEINDSLGHAAGDEMLRTVAERLRDYFEEEDLEALGIQAGSEVEMARLAGDEFALIAPRLADAGAATQLAERVLRLVAAPIEIGSQRLGSSASIGVALFPDDAGDVETLLRHADAALYVAKHRGRGRFAFYEPAFDQKADRKHKIEQGLRTAVDRRELFLHYQPKVDVGSGTVVGFEALLRWKSAELGDVGPREFIPVAEERGLIAALGAWCLEEACRQLHAWRTQGLAVVPVSVNVSSAQFRETDVLQVVSEALQRHGVEPRLLELELTERLLMEEAEETALALRDLRAFGIRVALDDFGTGYSALAYLNRFPIDVLKMDRSLLRDIESSPAAAGIASAVVSMAHSLGMCVVAEGVDSDAQLGPLREMRCNQIQGFLYAPALPSEEAERFLAAAGESAPRARPAGGTPGRIVIGSTGGPRPEVAPATAAASGDGPRADAPVASGGAEPLDGADADLPAEWSQPVSPEDADLPAERPARRAGRAPRPAAQPAQPASDAGPAASPAAAESGESDVASAEAPGRRVLLLDDEAGSLGPVGLRLARLGVDVHYAASRDEARLFVAQEGSAIRLLAVAPRVDLAHAAEILDLLGREVGMRLPLIALGEEPDADTRSRMRQAGVTWTLWAPFDDNELRFVVKAALVAPEDLSQRREPRVPVDLVAQVQVGERRELAVLSSLSSRGAFLELSDPPPHGSQLRVDFELPPERFQLSARVVHRQGEDAAAPLTPDGGVGVVFCGAEPAVERALRKAVEERATRYLP